MPGKFELYKDNAGEFRFRLKAGNGENILASEGYKAKPSALNGIESVKKNAGDEARYEIKTQSNGKPYFVLKAGNHEIIGKSQAYESEDGCKGGMQSVMNNAPDAAIDDQTA
ncbi:MAG: YegP family protein [Pseudomonadota bacterium]